MLLLTCDVTGCIKHVTKIFITLSVVLLWVYPLINDAFLHANSRSKVAGAGPHHSAANSALAQEQHTHTRSAEYTHSYCGPLCNSGPAYTLMVLIQQSEMS